MNCTHRLLLVFALAVVAGCSSGNNGGCDIGGGTGLATVEIGGTRVLSTDWPKFRRDLANTGRTDAPVADTQAERWVFPERPGPDGAGPDTEPLGNAITSPVITNDGRILVVAGKRDFPTVSRAYLIDPNDGSESGSFDVPLNSTASVSPGSTPVISESRIGMIFTDGTLREYDFDGNFLAALPASGSVTGSLTIDHEGTIYTATTNGVYSTLCASGGARYLLGIGGTESTAALIPAKTQTPASTNDDDVSVIASNDGKVRAFKYFGELLWTFTASAAVRASVVYDEDRDLIYGADANGLVFAVRAEDGRRCRNLCFDLQQPVVASPALVEQTLYVVDTTGKLYALDIQADCDVSSEAASCPAPRGSPTPTGSPIPAGSPAPSPGLVERWKYASDASVSSSPAAAVADGRRVIVFGDDNGTVHAVEDNPDQIDDPPALWTHCTMEKGAFGRSSVAIDKSGIVYATTAAGRLYAISAPTASPSATPSPSPTSSPQP